MLMTPASQKLAVLKQEYERSLLGAALRWIVKLYLGGLSALTTPYDNK